MAIFRPPPGIRRGTVVRVDYMARGTSGRAIIAGVIVRTHKPEQRIVQPRFLKVEHNRVDPVKGAQTALGQATGGPPGRLESVGVTDLPLFLTTFLKDAQEVGGLPDGEARERIQKRQQPIAPRHFGRDREGAFKPQRDTVLAVSLTVAVIFKLRGPVVIKRRTPEHRPVIHHAVTHAIDELRVTQAARLRSDAEVGRVHKTDKLG